MPFVQTMHPGELARPVLRKKPYPEEEPPVAAPGPVPQMQPVPQVQPVLQVQPEASLQPPAPTVPEVKPLIYGSQASRLLTAPQAPATQRPLRGAGTFYGLPLGPAPEAAASVPAERSPSQPTPFQMKVDPPRPLPSEPEDERERQRAAHEAEMKRLEGDPVTARFAQQLRGLEADEKMMRENIRATLPEAQQEEMVKKLETELLFERLRVGKAMNQAVNAEAESLRTAAGIAHRKGQQAYEERMAADEKSRAEPQNPLLGWANTIGDALQLPGPLNPGWWAQKVTDDFGPYDHQRKRVQQQVRSEEEAEVLRREAVKKTGLDPDNPEHARLLEDAKQMDWTAGGRQVGESAISGTGMAKAESLKNAMIQSLTEGKWEVNRAENSRLLADGSVVVNPLLIHDDVAYAKAVQEAQATPEAKRQAMDRLRDLQRGQAKALLPSLKSTPDFFPGEQFTDYVGRRAQEEPAFGVLPEAEQARLFLREQVQRGYGTRLADKLGTSLLFGTGDFFTQVNGGLAIATGGLPGVGEYFSQNAADLAMLGAMVDESTEARTGTGALGRVTGGVVRMLPPLVAQALITRGLRVNMLPEKAAKAVIYGLAGAQTAGGQYAALYGQLRQQGAGPMEAWLSASGPAMASGLATAGLTALGGATGTEALLLPGARGRVAQGVRGFWREALKNVPAHAMKEVPEEFFDEMASTVIEAMALGKDPKEALGGFLAESPEFIGSVMLLGGSGGLHSSRQQTQASAPVPLLPAQGGDRPVPIPPVAGAGGATGSAAEIQRPEASVPANPPLPTRAPAPAPSGLPLAVGNEVGGPAPQTSPDPMPPGQPPQAVSNHPEMAQATTPISHRVAPPAPPIWQGRARHGEDAAVLGRNPDGTFQVRLNGTEKTFKESQVAAMTGMQRGPLYAHLAQATRQQLALPHPPSLPPIWQGRARHGEDAAVLGRNPDGTFQVRLNGTEKTFKESQVAAMTGMQRGPLYEMLERATVNREKKAGQAPLPPQAIAGVPSSRLQFSRNNPADSEVVSVHHRIAESEDAFQLGKSKPETQGNAKENDWRDSLEELAVAYSVSESPLILGDFHPDYPYGYAFNLHTNKGSAFVIINPPSGKDKGTVQINSPGLYSNTEKGGGGAQVYQMVQTFAHNHGYTFLPEDTVSPIAQKRRISQMASSALRHGTTQHLNGLATYQDKATGIIKTEVPGWKPGDHDHNLALLLKAEHAYVMQEAQARGIDLSHLTHDLATDNILDGHTGTPITQDTLGTLVDRFKSRDSGVGETTLLRALVTGSSLQRGQPNSGVHHLQKDEGGMPGRAEAGRPSGELVSVARGLYYSRSPESAGGLPPRRVGDAVSRGPGGLATALAETARFLNQKQPGLVNERTHLFTTVEELLASDYARQYPFTTEQIASLRSAEGFHDTETGHSFVIAENTRLLPGESPQQALTRVILHERVGHAGLQILLGDPESVRSRRWTALSAQILPTELEAIAAETGYSHLAGRREDLAFEWFARRTEKELNLLEKGSLPRQMWDAFREMVMDFMASLDLKSTLGRSFETQVKDLQRRAREAALRPVRDSTNVRQVAPDSFRPQATPDRRSVSSLDDVNHLFTSPSNNPHNGSLAPHLPSLPPIWQGRARHGEDAAVLGRNPDGTFQVRLNGTEKTFKESQVAAMTGMQRGPLYAHLAQATRQQLALPHPPSLPPIWQGRARHGEDAAVLGRNPDGTFQVRIGGQERTRTERDVAYMTGMQRGPLYEMLGRATAGQNNPAALGGTVNFSGGIDKPWSHRFNGRRGDRTNIVVPGGLPHGQAGEFDRSVLFDEPIGNLFGALQTAAQILSSADGRQQRNGPRTGTNHQNETAPAATFEADGTIGIAGNPRLWAESLLVDNKGNVSPALKQAELMVKEEIWHVAQLVGMRNDWVRAGKPGSFVDWVHDQSTEIMESIGQAVLNGSYTDAAKIKQALFATWELYFAEAGHTQTPESVFRQLTSPVQRGRLVTRGTFLAEFTRQLHQAGVTGQTTETAGLLGRLRTWVQQALDGLKQAYAMARGGTMGQPLKDLIDRTEAVLQGRETALLQATVTQNISEDQKFQLNHPAKNESAHLSVYISFNKTHKDSRPIPKGKGPNGGRLQSHHGLQREWCLHNLLVYGYDPNLAPTITLETGVAFPHTAISKSQNSRRNLRIQSGLHKWSSTLQQELQYLAEDLTSAGFKQEFVDKVLNQQYKMLSKLNISFSKINH